MGDMKQRQIELHIEELILRDLPFALRHQVAAAIEQELTRLLNEQGLPPSLKQGAIIPSLDIGPVRLGENTRADALGSQIARNVYTKLWENRQPD